MPGQEWDDLQSQAAAEDVYDMNVIASLDSFCKVLGKMGPETVADVSNKLQTMIHKLQRIRRSTAVLLGGNDPEVDDMFRQLVDRIRAYDDAVATRVLIPSMQEMFTVADQMDTPGSGVQRLIEQAVAAARKFRAQERIQWAADRAETRAAEKHPQNGDQDVAF